MEMTEKCWLRALTFPCSGLMEEDQWMFYQLTAENPWLGTEEIVTLKTFSGEGQV